MAVAFEPVAPTTARDPARPLTVLIVDDDPAYRDPLEFAVSELGHRCITACDGEDALEKQRTDPADVILSDWSMPRMTGVELCRQIRAHPDAAYTYFVFMTGLSDKAHFLEGMHAGADDYLTKPFDLDELEARLLSGARVIRTHRALAARNTELRQERDRSFEAARIDPLTESANRLRLREDLDALQARSARYGHRYCAALCDVDFFKQFNDTYGHLAGDDALRNVAAAMHGALREADTLYRYGGEEFLVILSEQGTVESWRVMERVRTKVAALAIPHKHSPSGVLTISVGIAELGQAAVSCDSWLTRADAALYRAKEKGRNRTEIDETVFDQWKGLPKRGVNSERSRGRVLG